MCGVAGLTGLGLWDLYERRHSSAESRRDWLDSSSCVRGWTMLLMLRPFQMDAAGHRLDSTRISSLFLILIRASVWVSRNNAATPPPAWRQCYKTEQVRCQAWMGINC